MPITQSRMLEVLASAKICQDTLERLCASVLGQIARAQANAQAQDLTYLLLEHAVADARSSIQIAKAIIAGEAKHFAERKTYNAKMAERMAKKRALKKGLDQSTNISTPEENPMTYEEQQDLYQTYLAPSPDNLPTPDDPPNLDPL